MVDGVFFGEEIAGVLRVGGGGGGGGRGGDLCIFYSFSVTHNEVYLYYFFKNILL